MRQRSQRELVMSKFTNWEAAGGGLFGTSPIAGVSPGSRNVTIPDQVVVDVNGGVLDALLAQPPERFRTRFGKRYGGWAGKQLKLAENALHQSSIPLRASSPGSH
jgi:hypothetical protein